MTEPYAVTETPTDLVAALSLTVGTSYIVETVPGSPPVRLFEGGASAPADLSYFHVIQSGAAGRLGVTPATDVPIWVWSTAPSRLVVTGTP